MGLKFNPTEKEELHILKKYIRSILKFSRRGSGMNRKSEILTVENCLSSRIKIISVAYIKIILK